MALARLVTVCDLLLDESLKWLYPGAKVAPTPRRASRHEALLARYADRAGGAGGPAARPGGRCPARGHRRGSLMQRLAGAARTAGAARAAARACRPGSMAPCPLLHSPGRYARGGDRKESRRSMDRPVMQRRAPSLERPDGRLRGRLLRARRRDPGRGGSRPGRGDGGLHAPGGHPVRHRRGQGAAGPRAGGRRPTDDVLVEALDDGDTFSPREVVLRIRARYRRFGLYETAILGMLSQSTGWATAARDVSWRRPRRSRSSASVPATSTRTSPTPSTTPPSWAAAWAPRPRPAPGSPGLAPTGTMPHSLVLIFGDTVRAAEAFDRHLSADVPRIVLVDTFKDEAEEALRVAHALGDRLYGVRLDTPSERGRVTADLVLEVRARLDQAGFGHVRIIVSGGLDPERIGTSRRPVRRSTRSPWARTSAAPAHRLHRRPQADRRPADRQAGPHPGPHPEPSPATGGPCSLAGIQPRLSQPACPTAPAGLLWARSRPASGTGGGAANRVR